MKWMAEFWGDEGFFLFRVSGVLGVAPHPAFSVAGLH